MNKRRKGSNAKTTGSKPVLRFRHFLTGLTVVFLVTLIPFLAVSKQVYLRNESIRKSVIADSLAGRRSEIARLRVLTQTLSSNDRIESYARTRLNLDYPAIAQITVLETPRQQRAGMFDGWRFLTIVKKSISQGRG